MRTGEPCWVYFPNDAETFISIDDAEKWFENNKSFLFRDESYCFDKRTFGVRQIIYKKVGSLSC